MVAVESLAKLASFAAGDALENRSTTARTRFAVRHQDPGYDDDAMNCSIPTPTLATMDSASWPARRSSACRLSTSRANR